MVYSMLLSDKYNQYFICLISKCIILTLSNYFSLLAKYTVASDIKLF